MSLLTIAELLAGEALVTPGGPVDRTTAIGDDDVLWTAEVAVILVQAAAREEEPELATV